MGQRQLPRQGGNLWGNQGDVASYSTTGDAPSTYEADGQDKVKGQGNWHEESSEQLRLSGAADTF
tara:strand:+ start:483 stop:677 length:195 start_codon:yes stop_codon:yes gene_type:complete